MEFSFALRSIIRRFGPEIPNGTQWELLSITTPGDDLKRRYTSRVTGTDG